MENTEKKPRTARAKKSEKKQETKKPEENKIAFGFWFTTAIRAGKVEFWQDKEILVFFKNRGLSDRETKSKYDEMLKLY